ncbi:hypothetical protein [Clostridium formicaceticum]|uniref:Uncharacterized protein n=1 Tax=Clostridium formicaceticum TaxID=1497 RepID=A0ABM6EXN2_9CLOT|nr:hypothetical protein [Clostridium formicaceticum]AOY77872.1 hypothetical protein BJL90_19605 [Clostridium formicaceticum]
MDTGIENSVDFITINEKQLEKMADKVYYSYSWAFDQLDQLLSSELWDIPVCIHFKTTIAKKPHFMRLFCMCRFCWVRVASTVIIFGFKSVLVPLCR